MQLANAAFQKNFCKIIKYKYLYEIINNIVTHKKISTLPCLNQSFFIDKSSIKQSRIKFTNIALYRNANFI